VYDQIRCKILEHVRFIVVLYKTVLVFDGFPLGQRRQRDVTTCVATLLALSVAGCAYYASRHRSVSKLAVIAAYAQQVTR